MGLVGRLLGNVIVRGLDSVVAAFLLVPAFVGAGGNALGIVDDLSHCVLDLRVLGEN